MIDPGNRVSAAGSGRKRVLVVMGTRPEAIKMAPVIRVLRQTDWAEVRILATAQHRDMLDSALQVFGIVPDVDLDLMRRGQNLPELTSRLLLALDGVLANEAPDVVLAQGDTTTVMAVGLASFYRRIPVGHVEAGLRSGDMHSPFPEEMNRVVVSALSHWHFAPTEGARANLLREGVDPGRVHVTGNTVIDALLEVASRSDLPKLPQVPDGTRTILVTAHRRENFGQPLSNVYRAVRDLADDRSDVHFVCTVHPNPNVRDAAHRLLKGHPRIMLCDPMDYPTFVASMRRSYLIVTDSGGVQEEAPALAKPVLVVRRETERPEAVAAGAARLIGTNRGDIVAEVARLLDDPAAYAAMAVGASPYGDGLSAARIASVLRNDLFSKAAFADGTASLSASLEGDR